MFSSKKVIRSASNSQLSSFLETLEEPEEIQEEEMEEFASSEDKEEEEQGNRRSCHYKAKRSYY